MHTPCSSAGILRALYSGVFLGLLTAFAPGIALAQRPAKSKRWADSMARLLNPPIAEQPDYYRDQRKMLRYIRVSAALGDHYMHQYAQGDPAALPKAMRYYGRVTHLSDGPDSDLGDGEYATIRKRDSVCWQVAGIVSKGLWPADSGWSPYVGRWVDASKLRGNNHWSSPLSDSMIATIEFLPYTDRLTPDAQAALQAIADWLKKDNGQRIVLDGSGGNSYIAMQVSWEQVNAIINYLVEFCGIPGERFIFQYQGAGSDGRANAVAMRYAQPGEDGPSIVAPPFPGFTQRSRLR